jgi:hypothetical protein
MTIIATGSMLATAVAVADRLGRDGIDTRVLSMHTIKPLDTDAVIAAARETRAIVTLEEHSGSAASAAPSPRPWPNRAWARSPSSGSAWPVRSRRKPEAASTCWPPTGFPRTASGIR